MRRRRLPVRISLVAAVGPLLSSASALEGQAAPNHLGHGQARPVIDTDYLYQRLYDMSTSYIFRVSGLDGPSQDPSSADNLPANERLAGVLRRVEAAVHADAHDGADGEVPDGHRPLLGPDADAGRLHRPEAPRAGGGRTASTDRPAGVRPRRTRPPHGRMSGLSS
jgi:hypothetical protein